MKKIVRLTESDLVSIVKRVIEEQDPKAPDFRSNLIGHGGKTTAPITLEQKNLHEIKKGLLNFEGGKLEYDKDGIWTIKWSGKWVKTSTGRKKPLYEVGVGGYEVKEPGLEGLNFGIGFRETESENINKIWEKNMGTKEDVLGFEGKDINPSIIIPKVKKLISDLKNYEKKLK
jgi:hypothetical protein